MVFVGNSAGVDAANVLGDLKDQHDGLSTGLRLLAGTGVEGLDEGCEGQSPEDERGYGRNI